MKKDFYVDDVTCTIVLTKCAEKQTIKGTNPSLHEEYSRQVDVHVCRGYIGTQEIASDRFREWSPDEIEKSVKKVEHELQRRVSNNKAEEKHQKKVNEKLKELGF